MKYDPIRQSNREVAIRLGLGVADFCPATEDTRDLLRIIDQLRSDVRALMARSLLVVCPACGEFIQMGGEIDAET